MRMMMKVSMENEPTNRAATEGKLPGMFMDFIERMKPEAAYFVAENGKRTGIFFVDLASPEDIPSAAEPFFMTLGASIELTPAMNPAEMRAGIDRAMKKR